MNQAIDEEVRIEYMPLTELLSAERRAKRNPKQHDKQGIRASLLRFGFTLPAALDESTGRLVAGHGRTEGAHDLKQEHDADPVNVPIPRRVKVDDNGEWLVPVLRGMAFTSEREAEAYLLADNKLSEVGGWDTKAITAILNDLNMDGAVEGLGWSQEEISGLLADSNFADDLPGGDASEEEGSSGDSNDAAPKSTEHVSFSAVLTPYQNEAVHEAIKKAKLDTGCTTTPEALEHICRTYGDEP